MSDIKPPWPEVRLGDHATVKARLGWKGLKAEEYVPDGPLFLATPNLKRGRIDFERADHIPEWRYSESPEIQLREGDVLLVKDGSTLGISSLVRRLPEPTTVNGSIAVVRPNPTLDSGFLFYVINGRAFQKLIWLKRAGLGVPHLFQADLREFQISLPPMLQQRRIAEILSTLDDAIEQTEALIAKYQQIKAGLMHDLFTRGVTPDGHLRPPRTQAPHLYKHEPPLGWIPKEWNLGRLNDYLDPINGIKPGPFGSSLTKATYTSGGYRIYGQEQVIAGTFEIGNYYISEAKFLEMRVFEVLEGDVLLSLVGTVGCVLVADPPFEPGIINPRLVRLRPARGVALPRFVKHLLLTSGIRRQLDSLAGGGTMPVISGRVVRRLMVPSLKPDEQERIVGRLDRLDLSVDALGQSLQKLRLEKYGLMSDLLTGRVSVQKAKTKEVPTMAHASSDLESIT